MYLKVKYDTLNDTGKFFIDKSDELDNLAVEINQLIEDLKKYWDGKDYDVFESRYKRNTRKVTATAIELNAFGNALKTISGAYQGIDTDFEKRVRKMRNDKYEE